MKTIPLTQGKVALVDDADYEALSQSKWHFFDNKYGGYAARNKGRRRVYLHREVIKPMDGFEVDHRDGDGLNNQRSNLRLSTHQQNLMNRGVQKNNKCGHKNIRWDSDRHKWAVRVGVNRKTFHFGRFENLEDAITARDAAVIKLHGEFAFNN